MGLSFMKNELITAVWPSIWFHKKYDAKLIFMYKIEENTR